MSEMQHGDTQPATPDQRKANIARVVSQEVAGGSWRVESQSDYQAVLAKGGSTNHTLHLILTLVTCGVWAFAWIAVWAMNQRKTLVLTVDDYGNVLRQG